MKLNELDDLVRSRYEIIDDIAIMKLRLKEIEDQIIPLAIAANIPGAVKIDHRVIHKYYDKMKEK